MTSCILVILHTAVALLWIATAGLFWLVKIHGPTLYFQYPAGQYVFPPFEKEGKYHLGLCEVSTNTSEDLLINDTFSVEEALDLVRDHGAGIFESIVTKETAQALKDYAVKANHELTKLFVISRRHRHHIQLPHTEPCVQDLLKEVASHPLLRPVLDNLLGPSSSLMSLSIVSSEYGAKDQTFHPDSAYSYHGYPSLIVPEWTVSVALQDTTREMGATGICAGTHDCYWPLTMRTSEAEAEYEKAHSTGEFAGSLEEFTSLHRSPCNVTAVMKQGDAFLYSSDLIHAGRAHTDPDAPMRSQVFITLAGSRTSRHDKRELPIGNLWTLNRDMWGQTIDDFTTMNEQPWRPWHSVGLFHGKTNVIPWNYWDTASTIFRYSSEKTYWLFGDYNDRWTYKKLSEFVDDKVLRFTAAVTVVYISTLLLLRWSMSRSMNKK